jgi:hypothetical protein
MGGMCGFIGVFAWHAACKLLPIRHASDRKNEKRSSRMSTYTNPLTEYSPQMELSEFSMELESGGVFNEGQEMELASELLEIGNEQELENFLGDLVKKAGGALGKFVKSPIGHALGDILKAAAKKALPIAGGALGGLVGGPLGATLGSGLASMAGKSLGLELEGLSPEDREFEASKQFVKFAAETVKNALEAPPSADPAAAAHRAAMEAARTLAPGLMEGGRSGNRESETKRQTGRWVRHNGTIILFEV